MYLISYDVTEDRTRGKISKLLENYGVRVQYSVFECNISSHEYKKLYKEMLGLVAEKADVSIRIYPLDKDIVNKIEVIGITKGRYYGKDEVVFI